METHKIVCEIIRNAWKAHVLLTAYKLGLLNEICRGPASLELLCERLDCNQRFLEAVLNGLMAMGFVEKDHDAYEGTALAKGTVNSSLGNYLEFHSALEQPWARLADCAKSGKPPRIPFNMSEDLADVDAYLRTMEALGAVSSLELARMLPVKADELILDLGGGAGTYVRAILESQPQAKAVIVDRPAVCNVVRKNLLPRWNTGNRIEVVEGDYLAFEGRERYDWVLLCNILHNEGPSQVRQIFTNALSALKPNGRLVLLDYVHSACGDTKEPVGFETLLLLITEKGRIYTEIELTEMLECTGFRLSNHGSRVGDYVVLIARAMRS